MAGERDGEIAWQRKDGPGKMKTIITPTFLVEAGRGSAMEMEMKIWLRVQDQGQVRGSVSVSVFRFPCVN
jgi:hypothetical protein